MSPPQTSRQQFQKGQQGLVDGLKQRSRVVFWDLQCQKMPQNCSKTDLFYEPKSMPGLHRATPQLYDWPPNIKDSINKRPELRCLKSEGTILSTILHLSIKLQESLAHLGNSRGVHFILVSVVKQHAIAWFTQFSRFIQAGGWCSVEFCHIRTWEYDTTWPLSGKLLSFARSNQNPTASKLASKHLCDFSISLIHWWCLDQQMCCTCSSEALRSVPPASVGTLSRCLAERPNVLVNG